MYILHPVAVKGLFLKQARIAFADTAVLIFNVYTYVHKRHNFKINLLMVHVILFYAF
jgi:hypothetical protein